MLTWNWNGRLVSAGDMKVYTDDRIQVASLIMVDDDYDDDDENDDGGVCYFRMASLPSKLQSKTLIVGLPNQT